MGPVMSVNFRMALTVVFPNLLYWICSSMIIFELFVIYTQQVLLSV